MKPIKLSKIKITVFLLAATLASATCATIQTNNGDTSMPISSHYNGEEFMNTTATMTDAGRNWGQTLKIAWEFYTKRGNRTPDRPVPVMLRDAKSFVSPPKSPAVTWLGWNTVLIQMDGAAILCDPMLGHRASPIPLLGPARLHEAPCSVNDLPKLDAVIVSHDHYDHMDKDTVLALSENSETRFIVPLGVGAILRDWGLAPERIEELDWWQETRVKGIRFLATPARHFSGRSLTDANNSLWASWVMEGTSAKIYFGGDTGMFDGFQTIGQKEGPFDITLIPIGAYDPLWADIHLTPEEAVLANGMLGGKVMMPTHFATFNLAMHDWSDPMQRLLTSAQQTGTRLLMPLPGQTVTQSSTTTLDWWTAALAPAL